ncbi:hypothetical protein HS125_09480 [bacterium]|nr:hypothetical protein [bacterium]
MHHVRLGQGFRYYSPLQQGLREGRIPYHSAKEIHNTDRLLANPEVILSPQILVMRWVELPTFVLINTLLAYSVGFLGCQALRERYRLSLLPFTMFFVLFNFNGHIAAHLGIGHAIWTGYFFLPLFMWFVLKALEEPSLRHLWMPLSLLLFLIDLQGFFHGYILCVILLALAAVWNPPFRRTAALAIPTSFVMCACRFWPTLVTLYRKEHDYITGFTTVWEWLEGMVVPYDYTHPYVGGIFGKQPWAEFNHYVGGVGFAFLLYFGIIRRLSPEAERGGWRLAALDIPLAIMAVLSFDYFLAVTRFLPIPFAGTERVATRFFLLPFLFTILYAAVGLERSWYTRRLPLMAKVFLWAAVVQTTTTLWDHTNLWRPINIIDEYIRKNGVDLQNWIVVRPDPLYVAVVRVSLGVSLATCLAVLALWGWKARWRIDPPSASGDNQAT